MITRFFRTNYIGQYILTFVLSIVLWMGAFINPQPMETTNSFLYESLYNLFSPYPLLSTILAYLIVLIGAFYFNNMLYKHKLIPHNNFLPAFLCLLMASAMPSQTLSPMLVSGIFILISLNYVLDCDDMNKTTNKVFSAALMISVASLFYQVSLYFLAYLLISFLVYKIYSWREWIIIFLGYALPQIILLVYCFMTDKLTVLLDYSAQSIGTIDLVVGIHSWFIFVLEIFFILILVVSFMNFLAHSSENIISYRKKSYVIFSIFLISIVLALYTTIVPLQTLFLSIPFSYFLSIMILRQKRKLIFYDVFLVLLIVSVIFYIYFR